MKSILSSMNDTSDNDNEEEFYEFSSSTTPLSSSKDDTTENDEVRRLAARLAPTLEKAEELLALPPEFDRIESSKFSLEEKSSLHNHEDDDMDRELEELATAEEMLRQELEDIQAFSNLFHYPLAATPVSSITKEGMDPSGSLFDWHSSLEASPQPSTTTNASTAPCRRATKAAVVEADMDGELVDMAPEQKFVKPRIRIPASPRSWLSSSPLRTPKSNNSSLLRMGTQLIPYHTQDHQKVLGVERNVECGWYTVDLTRHVASVAPQQSTQQQHSAGLHHHGLEEICPALPLPKIQPWFIGLQGGSKKQPNQSSAAPLPVRTLMIRLRPDVLCGAVMDAIASSLVSAKVWKRQGGHLRALIRSQYDELTARMFVVDAQVVTFKSMECRRILLIRIYHADANFPDRDPDEEDALAAENAPATFADNPIADGAMDPAASLHLREACALLERIEYPSTSNKALHRPAQSPSMSDREAMSHSVRQHLLDHYQACPSVRDGQPTLPSLNPVDWPVVQASWPWIYEVWSELENRSLTYTSLRTTTAFGKFPSLPTLDVHYCSQMRRYSRETMILELLNSASGLEEYARQAEYACASMISLLQPTFEAYEVDSPVLPEPVPLTSYPLDFVPPQTECPPWGLKVMEALNHVQAASSSTIPGFNEMDNLFTGEMPASLNLLDSTVAEDSLKRAEEAVTMVFTAFQRQDDHEKGARLARKNMQVMDRLSKMEEHQRLSISALSTSDSPKARKAAGDLHSKTKILEVPLVKWSVMVGSSSGTCWATAKRLLFSTQLIPVLGTTTRQVFAWNEISLSKSETTPSLLNPLSFAIHVEDAGNGETLLTFRPSVGGSRLFACLKVLQSTAATMRKAN